ncbi:LacI family transcriptional regulator [Rhodococcus sp. Leaf7]|uniref:LacI family DNA-binding transcriptional regulator n=1 Tax=unclassified Rhodococcus (in: high G+C Gram-positive bacteria) TaxID=192944 RepID=UPI000701F6DA|nr:MULTISPECIES: substrate-binding domain-containing protein [unclassified Rhodococcus (in: high G+C Gram-positive bacteria)]KQU07381.1 LacI family transcriptional regulator [Rhodococcus sp. Leaf7]KQU42901.1 LacI family transcriptional regulator [Rhodococcus sp. Leaf247]
MARSTEPRRMATLASLAAELNISRTTVSNAYNRPDQLSPEMRLRILDAARARGYPGPDPVARSLRTRRAGAVGLVLTEALSYSFSDPAAVQFLTGLAESCEQAGRGLLLIPAGPASTPEDAAAVVQQAGVDAFVVYSVSDDDPHLTAVRERHLPTVVCDQPRDAAETSLVGIDDRAAMREIAEQVLAQGHTEIAVLCMRLRRDRHDGPVGRDRRGAITFHVQRERIAGITDAMTAAGVDPDVVVVERFEHSRTAGRSAAAEALEAAPGATALICTSDVLALGALDHLDSLGIDVPGRMSVTGFDGVDEAVRVGLTTVRQPVLEKGRLVGEIVLGVSHSGVDRTEHLPTHLLAGVTLGPVRTG